MMGDKLFKHLDKCSNEMRNISNETAYILYDFSRQLFSWVTQQYGSQAILYLDELFTTLPKSQTTSSDEVDEKKPE